MLMTSLPGRLGAGGDSLDFSAVAVSPGGVAGAREPAHHFDRHVVRRAGEVGAVAVKVDVHQHERSWRTSTRAGLGFGV